MYRSYGTFSYRERLKQQNGDIGKRNGVKTICIWPHLVQGHVYSSLSPPSPPLTPPFKCDNKGSRPACHFRPPLSPPHRIMDRFWQPRPKSRMASTLKTVSMIAEFGQQLWSYTNFQDSDRTLRSRDRIFEFSQEMVKICAAARNLDTRVNFGKSGPQPAGTVRERRCP